jgi:uncharacterized protein
MNDADATIENHDPSPWGPLATTGIGLLVLTSFLIAPLVAELIWKGVLTLVGQNQDLIPPFATNGAFHLGFFVSLTSMASALLGTVMIWIAVRLRRYRYPSLSVRHYLVLYSFRWRTILFWAGLTLVYLIGMDAVSYWTGRSRMPDFMIEAYATAGWTPLFWIAIGVVAPFFEELFFRGFLLTGFRQNRRRIIIAVLVISAAWAAIHLQYGWYENIWIFGLGLLFSAARLSSGSLWVPIILHMLCNLIATFQVAYTLA